MAGEINWERTGYESRIDWASSEISEFVGAVLKTIDAKHARKNREQWEIVCRYFSGCARAARQQRGTPLDGGKEIARYIADHFPWDESSDFNQMNGSIEGFYEFMDWLSNPDEFHPNALRIAIEKSR